MGLEIERRFLVLGEAWRALAGPPQPFRQGYLVSGELGFSISVYWWIDPTGVMETWC